VAVNIPELLIVPMLVGLTDHETVVLKFPEPATFGIQVEVWFVWIDVGEQTTVTAVTEEDCPVPVSMMLWGEPPALSVILSAAVAAPTAFGSKRIVNVHEALTATLAPQLLLMRNDKAFVPVSLRLLMVSTPVPVFAKVAVLVELSVLMF